MKPEYRECGLSSTIEFAQRNIALFAMNYYISAKPVKQFCAVNCVYLEAARSQKTFPEIHNETQS